MRLGSLEHVTWAIQQSRAGFDELFLKGSDSKYFSHVGYMVFVITAKFCCVVGKQPQTMCNK